MTLREYAEGLLRQSPQALDATLTGADGKPVMSYAVLTAGPGAVTIELSTRAVE